MAVTADELMCTGTITLPDGQLTFTQPFSNATLKGVGAITGGTGHYVAADGTFEAVGRPGTQPAVYDYRLHITG